MVQIAVGMNGRFFPNNWRPALQEIGFAAAQGFRYIQFPGRERGLAEADLGAPLAEVGRALDDARLGSVMEIVLRVDMLGYTADGRLPVDVLAANLPAIAALRCTHVHWHVVPLNPMGQTAVSTLEYALVPQFAKAAALAAEHGFKFGFEHNEPELLLHSTPERCGWLLGRVPGLHFVWDFNHTIPAHFDAFTALIPRMSMLHVSDTPLPEVNYHLPLGLGTLDYGAYCRLLLDRGFDGPAVLEIGGLPKSGGYGRDTDAALIDSLHKLNAVLD